MHSPDQLGERATLQFAFSEPGADRSVAQERLQDVDVTIHVVGHDVSIPERGKVIGAISTGPGTRHTNLVSRMAGEARWDVPDRRTWCHKWRGARHGRLRSGAEGRGAARASREPRGLGHDLEAADRRIIAGCLRQFGRDRLSRKGIRLHVVR